MTADLIPFASLAEPGVLTREIDRHREPSPIETSTSTQ